MYDEGPNMEVGAARDARTNSQAVSRSSHANPLAPYGPLRRATAALRGYEMLYFTLFALFVTVQGRAVNISNTWVLPEEGFPVFYRYFRDRISWYEADAVCQFHHANLVTVDTTAQYDAVRAYLKELDISSAVWVGLIRSNPDGDFTWTDYRGLSGDGYWSSAPDTRAAPLCAAADPSADYRWEARACGGPTVASFICELPVPQWALGSEGCMVRELPALTVLYLPESAAVQLTADCGLAGVKRVQCTGNVKREDLLKNLSCEEEETSSTMGITSTGTIWSITTDTVFTDSTTSEATTEGIITTEHEDDINQPADLKKTVAPYRINTIAKINTTLNDDLNINNVSKILTPQTINIIRGNNLQSNEIPRLVGNRDILTEITAKAEDENLMRHKMIHEEIARRGNLENIFTQPTDHFVPPLVMAKAKISDDMTVLSLEEKYAQQLAEKRLTEHNTDNNNYTQQHLEVNFTKSNTKNPMTVDINEAILITTVQPLKITDDVKKNKSSPPKKYHEKLNDPKGINFKPIDVKPSKVTALSPPQYNNIHHETKTPTVNASSNNNSIELENDPVIELTVIIKDSDFENKQNKSYSNYSRDLPKMDIIKNYANTNNRDSINDSNIVLTTKKSIIQEINSNDILNHSMEITEAQHVALNQEISKTTVIHDEISRNLSTVFEITTKSPKRFHIENGNDNSSTTTQHLVILNHSDILSTHSYSEITMPSVNNFTTEIPKFKHINKNNNTDKFTQQVELTTVGSMTSETLSTNSIITDNENKNNMNDTVTATEISNELKEKIDFFNNTQFHDDRDLNITNTADTIDDFQSPLLSGANEPLHRPNRSRRPQQTNRISKFNPFRILG